MEVLKQDLSRRDSEISGLNRKVDQLVKDLNEKTGNASDAYAKLNEIHQVSLSWVFQFNCTTKRFSSVELNSSTELRILYLISYSRLVGQE